jgi:hypothetical protein
MRSTAAAEVSPVDKPAKTVPSAPRKRTRTSATAATTAKRAPRSRAAVVRSAPAEVIRPAPALRSWRASAAFGLVLATAVATWLIFEQRDDAPPADASAAVAVSAGELASLVASEPGPVYWAGPRSERTLELTRATAGTFVRYLPAGVAVGGSQRALTIATYPLRDAYGTVVGRAKSAGMTSSATADGGLAVWSKAQPTSVYVAFRGVPSLIEVYAPEAAEARTLALSGKLRPVR